MAELSRYDYGEERAMTSAEGKRTINKEMRGGECGQFEADFAYMLNRIISEQKTIAGLLESGIDVEREFKGCIIKFARTAGRI